MTPLNFTPEQREDIRRRIKKGEGAKEIAASFDIGRSTLTSFVQRHDLGPWRTRVGMQKATMPSDFVRQSWGKTTREIATHYGITMDLARKFKKRVGLPDVAPARPAPRKQEDKPNRYQMAAVERVQRDTSAAGRAQEVLQRDRWTVFRCNASGKADVAGQWWLCGRVICSDQELIERAARAERRMRIAA